MLDDLDVVVHSIAKDQLRLLADRGEDQVLHRAGDASLSPDDHVDGVPGLYAGLPNREAIPPQYRADCGGQLRLLRVAACHGVQKLGQQREEARLAARKRAALSQQLLVRPVVIAQAVLDYLPVQTGAAEQPVASSWMTETTNTSLRPSISGSSPDKDAKVIAMTKDQLLAWANDPRRLDTLPFGLYEEAYRKGITGAALVIRGVLYFRDGHTPEVRQSLVRCFDQYSAAIEEYHHALEVAAGQKPSQSGPLRGFYTEGQEPVGYDKAPGLAHLARTVSADDAMAVELTSADHKLAAGFYDFQVFTQSERDSELKRGLDVLAFSVPRAFLVQRPAVFQALFNAFAEALATVNGHAGLAVNVPPMGRRPNEASEFFYSRRFGPGIDVGDPNRYEVCKLYTKIKTVDWLNALNAELVRELGGATALGLPPDWFIKQPLGEGGLLIQAGVAPEAGISNGPGKPVSPAAAYVLLNHALRPIVTDALAASLQDGTLDSSAPLLNTRIATENWLRRFNVPEDQINGWWVQLHTTPKVTDARAAIEEQTRAIRQRMGLPDWPA
jgi:hypothetical protein